MAICRADYEIFKAIRRARERRPSSVCELGEAEFYGDVPFQELLSDVKQLGTKEAFVRAAKLIERSRAGETQAAGWGLSKVVYDAFLGATEVTSIDLHGSETAHRIDLNLALHAKEQFDVVFNTGTAEHVFRAANALEYAHQLTKHQGLMVHCFPFRGLIDHGFWMVNPTLVYDLARANHYEVLFLTLSVIHGPLIWLDPATGRERIRDMARDRALPDDSWLHVAYLKTRPDPFVVPTQAIYSDSPDPELASDWKSLR